MRDSSPRLWPYAPANSPVALPESPLFFSNRTLSVLSQPSHDATELLTGASLQTYCASFTSPDGTVDELLAEHSAAPMSQRRPFLLLGELANPTGSKTYESALYPSSPSELPGFAGHMQTALIHEIPTRACIISPSPVCLVGGKKPTWQWQPLIK